MRAMSLNTVTSPSSSSSTLSFCSLPLESEDFSDCDTEVECSGSKKSHLGGDNARPFRSYSYPETFINGYEPAKDLGGARPSVIMVPLNNYPQTVNVSWFWDRTE